MFPSSCDSIVCVIRLWYGLIISWEIRFRGLMVLRTMKNCHSPTTHLAAALLGGGGHGYNAVN